MKKASKKTLVLFLTVIGCSILTLFSCSKLTRIIEEIDKSIDDFIDNNKEYKDFLMEKSNEIYQDYINKNISAKEADYLSLNLYSRDTAIKLYNSFTKVEKRESLNTQKHIATTIAIMGSTSTVISGIILKNSINKNKYNECNENEKEM